MRTESDLLKVIQLEATKLGSRLFRNNNGVGWVGKTIRVTSDGMMFVRKNSVVIESPRPLVAGLEVGSGDLIGWTPVLITAEMIGRTIPVFTNIEGKSPDGSGYVRKEQKNFNTQVLSSGGISGIVKSIDEYKQTLSKFFG